MGGGRPADLVLRGGHAYLVYAARSWAEAVAVAGGRITAVGTDAEVSALTGPHLATALAAFTIGSAYVNHAEFESGSVEAGKRADLVVLDRNVFGHPVGEIALAQVDLTIVDGAVVYAR